MVNFIADFNRQLHYVYAYSMFCSLLVIFHNILILNITQLAKFKHNNNNKNLIKHYYYHNNNNKYVIIIIIIIGMIMLTTALNCCHSAFASWWCHCSCVASMDGSTSTLADILDLKIIQRQINKVKRQTANAACCYLQEVHEA